VHVDKFRRQEMLSALSSHTKSSKLSTSCISMELIGPQGDGPVGCRNAVQIHNAGGLHEPRLF